MAELLPELESHRLRLLSRIGEGGMATVYRAWDEVLRVERAVKMLSPALAQMTTARQRFIAEARTMAKLRHPNIVTVHGVRVGVDRPYMVMELLRGGTLYERISRHGPLPPAQAAAVISILSDAVAYAHAQGVIHRDIKPQNVLLSTEGTPFLADFGIAQVREGGPRTRTGVQLGTWAYMSPEQREDTSQVDHRTDIYALGAVLFTLVTARTPLDLHSTEIREPALKDVDPHIADIIRRATRAHRDDRYPSAAAIVEALEAVSGDLPTPPPETPPLAKPESPQPSFSSATFPFEPAETDAVSAGASEGEEPTIEPDTGWTTTARTVLTAPTATRALLIVGGIGLGWLIATQPYKESRQRARAAAAVLAAPASLGHVAVSLPDVDAPLSVELLCPEAGYRDIDPLEDQEALFSEVPSDRCVLRLLRGERGKDAWFSPVVPNTALSCALDGDQLVCRCTPLGGPCPSS